jgi:hypothetical protein
MCTICFGTIKRRTLIVAIPLLLLKAEPSSAAGLNILTRKQWGAAPAGQGLVAHKPLAVLIHHTGVASKPQRSLTSKIKGLQSFSQRAEKLDTGKMKPAWPDVPYHFLIDPSGQIAEGRDPLMMGDTNTDYSPKGYLQIAVEGNFTTETPTSAQITSTLALAKKLVSDFNLKSDAIYFHNEKASTQCPGENLVSALAKQLR